MSYDTIEDEKKAINKKKMIGCKIGELQFLSYRLKYEWDGFC